MSSKANNEARIMERKVIFGGAYVFREGDVGDLAYLVQSGAIEIVKKDGDGREVILGTVKDGGIFGEMALIDDQPRMASARALVATTVIVVNRDQFKTKLEKADPFIRGLLRLFVRNIRDVSNRTIAGRHDSSP